MSTDDLSGETTAEEGRWNEGVNRRNFLRLGGITAGGLALTGVAGTSSAAAFRGLTAAAKSAPLANKTMAVSEPIVVEAITSFVVAQQAAAKQPGAGEKVITANSSEKDPLQHEQVASFVEKKVNAILFFLITAAGWETDVANANKHGIATFNHSASAVTGMTQNCGLDQYGAGFGLGEAAAAWLNKNKGGNGDWGLLAITNDPQLILRGQGAAAAMKQYAPNANLVSTVFAQLETDGSAAASNMLAANPNLVMILSAGDDPAFGALTVVNGAGKTSAQDFFIGGCDGSDEALADIAKGGVFQATSDFLFPFSATQLERDAEKIFRGQGKGLLPTRIMKPITVTAANLKKIQAIQKNPLAPDVQYIYKTNIEWSHTQLKTNEPFANAFK
jgi:ABC-type sugar transport system substrate-binding protein